MPFQFEGMCRATGHTLFSHTDTPTNSSSDTPSPFQDIDLTYDFARFNRYAIQANTPQGVQPETSGQPSARWVAGTGQTEQFPVPIPSTLGPPHNTLCCQALCQGSRPCMFKADKSHPPRVHLCYHTDCPCGLPFIQDDQVMKLKELRRPTNSKMTTSRAATAGSRSAAQLPLSDGDSLKQKPKHIKRFSRLSRPKWNGFVLRRKPSRLKPSSRACRSICASLMRFAPAPPGPRPVAGPDDPQGVGRNGPPAHRHPSGASRFTLPTNQCTWSNHP